MMHEFQLFHFKDIEKQKTKKKQNKKGWRERERDLY
jgi:hypothetical protein